LKSKLKHTGTRSAAAHPPAAGVIAQQYSYATFVSLRFHSGKEKCGGPFKYVNVEDF
jgi:hypothetical protein